MESKKWGDRSIFIKLFIVAILLIYASIFNDLYSEKTLYIAAFINFIIAFGLAMQFKRSPFIFPILFLYAYTLYSIFIGRYYKPEIAPINIIIDYGYDKSALLIILLVSIILVYLLKSSKNFHLDFSQVFITKKTSKYFAFASLAAGVMMQLLYLDTSIIGERAGYTPEYEYSIVFYIFALYYSHGLNSNAKWAIALVITAFVFRDFYYGHRVTGLQSLSALYFFRLSHFYSFSRFIYVFILGISFMLLVSSYRADFSLDISIVEILKSLFGEHMLSLNTAVYAYVASLTFIATRDLLSFEQVLTHLYNFIVSMIIPGTYGQSLYEISKEYYQHANGGILPMYLYFYLGWVSIPLTAVLMSKYMNLIYKLEKKRFKKFYVLIFSYIFVTSSRWIMYSPNQLFRGVLLFSTVFLFLSLLEKILEKLPSKVRA